MRSLRIIIAEPPDTTGESLAVAEIIKFISRRFLGVLINFGLILDLPTIDKQLQHDTLLSLGEIIRFMGSELITTFRLKILSILKSASRHALRDTCVQVWKIFIYTVDIQTLGSLLAILFISLEPFMLTHPNEIDEILQYLLISNSSLLSVHISDLFFIDDTNASQDVKTFVVQHSDSLQMANSFMAKFRLYFKHATHDNVNVRIYGLTYLTRLFEQHRKDLNDLVLGQLEVSELVERLLVALMAGCRHLDKSLQLTAAKCLGRIGAIEPSHLSTNYAPQTNFAITIHSDEFAIMGLKELCRAANLQKQSKNIDGFSLAIQEILITRGVNLEQRQMLHIWEAIPPMMRSLMEPLLTSCYTVIPNKKSFGHPIFANVRCESGEQWAINWATTLIDFYMEHKPTKQLLISFKLAMKNDTNILMSFLPFVIVHTLQSASDEHHQKMYEELSCVFNAVINGNRRSNNFNDDIRQKCAKIAFEQIDFLDRWLRTWIVNTPIDYERVKEFVGRFDKKFLAKVNFECGEFARALMYTESYIEKNSQEGLQPELSFLAQIYAELLDTDSLAGAFGLKDEKLTLTEEAMLNMALGRLQASTVCFENMIQNNDMSSVSVVNMMQCYLGLNQPETAMRISKSFMTVRDHNADLLLQANVEPLWQLSSWDTMDTYLDAIQCRQSDNWPVRCAEVLLSFRKPQNDGNFFEEVEKCRLSVLKELRSTGDEQSSYNKEYPLVLKLHLITEIEGAYSALKNFESTRSTDVYNELFGEWNGRLELLQPTAR